MKKSCSKHWRKLEEYQKKGVEDEEAMDVGLMEA